MTLTADDITQIGQLVGVSFLAKELAKPSLARAGEKIRDAVFSDKTDQKLAMLKQATAMLDEVGDRPQKIPGRILFQTLEHGSWEEEPELQRKWAALLANAASSTDANKVLPAFTEILRQLTPPEAQILDWMFDMAADSSIGFLTWPPVARRDVEERFALSPADYALFIADLDRLQVLEGHRETDVPPHLRLDDEVMQSLILARWDSRVKYDFIRLTTLGVRFMFACTSPRRVREINDRLKSR